MKYRIPEYVYINDGKYTYVLNKSERMQCVESPNFRGTGMALVAILTIDKKEFNKKREWTKAELRDKSEFREDKSLIGTATVI